MNQFRKFLDLASTDRHLLVGTALLLGAIRLGLKLLPFQTVRRFVVRMPEPTGTCQETDSAYIDKVAWAVTVASRLIPGARCLERALAARVLLGWRGYPVCLRVGVAKNEKGQLLSHAWLEIEGRVAIGRLPDLSSFTPISLLSAEKPQT